MAGVEKTWSGRVRLGMKVVIIEWRVVVDMMVDVLMVMRYVIPLDISQLALPLIR